MSEGAATAVAFPRYRARVRVPRWRWLWLLALLCGCAGSAPLDQHLLQEILDQQDRRLTETERLRQHLRHRNTTVRAWAARALGAVGADAATPALAHTLETDAEPTVRREAAFALGLLEPTHPSLRHALRADSDPTVRALAAWALGRGPGATQHLAAGLGDPNADVRAACATALALRSDPETDAHVVPACWREADPSARATMLTALAHEPSPRAANVLRAAALQSSTRAMRATILAGVRGLTALAERHRDGWWLSPNERRRLRSYLRSEEPALAVAAAELLIALGGHDAGEDAADEQALLDAGVGNDAVLARGWAHYPWSPGRRSIAAEILERAAVGPDPAVRAAALAAYAAVAPGAALRMVRQSLAARDARQRAVAVHALDALATEGSLAAGMTADLWTRARLDRSPLVRDALVALALRTDGRDPNTPLGRLVHLAPAVAEALTSRIPDVAANLRPDILMRGLPTVDADDTVFRVALVRAIALLAEGESSSAAELQILRADPDPAVRRTVQDLGGDRPEPWPTPQTFRLGIDLPWSAFTQPPRVRVTTAAGPFEIELDAAAAPVHVERLVARIRAGALASGVRRRDSSIAVLGNLSQPPQKARDLLRRELAPTQLSHRGIVGFLPAAVPDCDGPDLFVTLTPRPDLLGSVTIVGRVSDGIEIVEALRAGDRILDIELLPGSD